MNMDKKHIKIGIGLFLGIMGIAVFANSSGNFFSPKEDFFVGTVEARELDVRNKIPGRISQMMVAEGEDVKEGQLLYTIDPKDLEVKRLQAEAGVKAAEAQLQKGMNGARAEDIQSAKSLADKALAKAQLLEKKHQGLTAVYEAGGLSRDKLNEFETELLASQLDAEAANQQYQMAVKGARFEDILALQAQHDAALAVLEEVKINMEETEVRAPIAGSISMMISNQGELIGTGTPVATITDYTDAWVEFNTDETKIGSIQVGDRYVMRSKAYPDKEFFGQVTSINKNPDFAIKKSTNELNDQDVISYGVKLKIESDGTILYPGMMVEVSGEKVAE